MLSFVALFDPIRPGGEGLQGPPEFLAITVRAFERNLSNWLISREHATELSLRKLAVLHDTFLLGKNCLFLLTLTGRAKTG